MPGLDEDSVLLPKQPVSASTAKQVVKGVPLRRSQALCGLVCIAPSTSRLQCEKNGRHMVPKGLGRGCEVLNWGTASSEQAVHRVAQLCTESANGGTGNALLRTHSRTLIDPCSKSLAKTSAGLGYTGWAGTVAFCFLTLATTRHGYSSKSLLPLREADLLAVVACALRKMQTSFLQGAPAPCLQGLALTESAIAKFAFSHPSSAEEHLLVVAGSGHHQTKQTCQIRRWGIGSLCESASF